LKANLLQAFGPDYLKFTDVPDPSPGPGEVMIKVIASGVNPRRLLHGHGHEKR